MSDIVKPLLVDAKEAAELLDMSPRQLWKLTAPKGELECIRFGWKTGV